MRVTDLTLFFRLVLKVDWKVSGLDRQRVFMNNLLIFLLSFHCEEEIGLYVDLA